MPVVVWDLGTATTLDAVDSEGLHLGGWILPGPATMLSGLGGHTRLEVPSGLEQAPGEAPGRTTAEAIAGGVIAAQIGALDRFLEVVASRSCPSPVIVATGGAAPRFAALRGDVVQDPWAVFRGMLIEAGK
jgi:type III pantothenate kinase